LKKKGEHQLFSKLILFGRKIILKKQEGFALPSVLYMITILSLLILSIVMLKYFYQQNALLSVAQVKSDYAAIDGVNRAIVELNSHAISPQFGMEIAREYDFGQNGKAVVKIQHWGLYYAIFSEGWVGRVRTQRHAVIANMPTSQFENALYFANTEHQLVMTGSAQIKGNVITGISGVTTGTIANFPAPLKKPIEGNIKREISPSLSLGGWKQQVEYFAKIQKGEAQISSSWGNSKYVGSSFILDNNSVTDELNSIVVNGNLVINNYVKRRPKPLYILCNRVIFEQGAELKGLVAILSREEIVVPHNVSIQSAILFSSTLVQVDSNCTFSGQILAPAVEISSGARLDYPSTVVSFQSDDSKIAGQGITLRNGSLVEGALALLTEGNLPIQNTLINIEPGAKVTGAVVCEGAITLDGSVAGTVLTKEFYFYEAPTVYMGWIRTGHINREELPLSYLVPTGFGKSNKLDVLEWY